VSERFNQIIAPHLQTLYASAYRWTQSQAEAEDLVQDLVLKLMDDLDSLEALDHPLSWMKKVLYRMFVDKYRRAQFSVVMPGEDVSTVIEEQNDSHLDEGAESQHDYQLQQGLIEAMETLDGPQRVALSLFEMEGYSLQEIAEIQEVSVGTVKSRVHRAKEKLKNCIYLQPFQPQGRVKG